MRDNDDLLLMELTCGDFEKSFRGKNNNFPSAITFTNDKHGLLEHQAAN